MGKESTDYEIRKEGLKDKARITRINIRKAVEIYKNTKTPEQQLIEICANVNGWEGRIGTIPKPPSKYISPKSNMAKFIMKYKKPPGVGLTVEVVTNDKGYWAIVM